MSAEIIRIGTRATGASQAEHYGCETWECTACGTNGISFISEKLHQMTCRCKNDFEVAKQKREARVNGVLR